MSPRPWMPLYVADYRAGTARLSTAEHGAYLLLIMEYWHAGGLPDDDKLLARIACMSAQEWSEAKPTIEPLFQPGWKHKRIDAELARAAVLTNQRRAASAIRHGKSRAQENAAADSQCDVHVDAPAFAAVNLPATGPASGPANGYANAPAFAHTLHTSQFTKLSEADASAAPADARTELFGRGLETLGRLAGRPPPACRPLLGKLLKSAGDDAARVLRAIDDAERNRVADPLAWIVRAVQPRQHNGKTSDHRFRAALERLKDHVFARDEHLERDERDERSEDEGRENGSGAAARLLPKR